MRRILITGASGCLGRAVSARAGARGLEVVALDRATLDVTDAEAREKVLDRHRPEAVLFCAAFTRVDDCPGNAEAFAVNVDAPTAWARRVPTWWISSNFVFHDAGPHAEDATPSPRGAYALQKVAGEQGVLGAGGHVVRVGWVTGPGGKTFPSKLASRLRRGETVQAVADVIVQPTWSEDLADALLSFPEGTTHLIGSGETTWHELALRIAARVGSGGVVPVRQADLALPEPRPQDARLAPATLPPWWDRLDAIANLR